jgi:integrase
MSPRRKPGSGWVPKLTWHKGPDGRFRGRVRINGVDHYLGDREDPETVNRYKQKVAEWLGNDRTVSPEQPGQVTVAELLAAFLRHAETYYVKKGIPTSEVFCFRKIISILIDSPYSDRLAGSIGAAELRGIRELFLQQTYRSGKQLKRWTRGNVNEQVNRVRRIWSWGHTHLGIPLAALQSQREVRGLAKTRTAAPEGKKIPPVSREQIERTLPWLPAGCLRELILVHSLLGCRMDEICCMRINDLDRSGPVWKYSPQEHKTQHIDKPIEAHYWVGPRAQAILAPLLEGKRDSDWVFPLVRKGVGKGCYNRSSYLHAVVRAWKEANRKNPSNPIEPWSPRQIRHLRLTEIKLAVHQLGKDGQEAAQAVAGHADRSTTAIYAELSDLARETQQQLG